jgi:hypothetical protein
MSEIGSVIFFSYLRHVARVSFSPATLCHACDVALECQLPEAQAAERELAHVCARSAAAPAPIAQADLELRELRFFCNLRGRGHSY